MAWRDVQSKRELILTANYMCGASERFNGVELPPLDVFLKAVDVVTEYDIAAACSSSSPVGEAVRNEAASEVRESPAT
jgi:hypothetical protein